MLKLPCDFVLHSFEAYIRNASRRIGGRRIHDHAIDGTFKRDGLAEIRPSDARDDGAGGAAARRLEPGKVGPKAVRLPEKVPTGVSSEVGGS